MISKIKFLVLFSLLPLIVTGQSLTQTLGQLSEDAARRYVSPIVSSFGSSMNSGWFHRSPAAKMLGFDLEIGMVGMGSFFPESAKHFEVNGKFIFNTSEAEFLLQDVQNEQIRNELINLLTTIPSQVKIEGATIIGLEDDYLTIDFPGGTYSTSFGDVTLPSNQIQLPIGGFKELAEIAYMPFAAFQINIGTLAGTQFSFRFLPTKNMNSDLGEFTYSGFGLQHNPFVWFKKNPLPFNLSIAAYGQSLKIGNHFKTSTGAFGITASKQFGWRFLNFTPYAGIMAESTKMEVEYLFSVETPAGIQDYNVNFSLLGENKARFLLGANLRFLVANLNADVNLGKYKSVTIALSFIL